MSAGFFVSCNMMLFSQPIDLLNINYIMRTNFWKELC